MTDTGDDWTRLLQRFNNKVDRIQSAQMAQTNEISHLISMQNRIIRDLVQIKTRVGQLENIAAYRTKLSDENDPIKQASAIQNSSNDQK